MDQSKTVSQLRAIRENIRRVIVGKDEVIDLLLITMLSAGHVLIEDIPGTGKTTLASALAASLGCSFRRIQFTPDVLPSDITGFTMFNIKTGEQELHPGSVMHQVVLADEINRTSPKTQSALLEVMQENQVTIDGVTYAAPAPFMVLATQNPVEMAGTYPLPEAQLDRFLMCVSMGYPSHEEEMRILENHRAAGYRLRQGRSADAGGTGNHPLRAACRGLYRVPHRSDPAAGRRAGGGQPPRLHRADAGREGLCAVVRQAVRSAGRRAENGRARALPPLDYAGPRGGSQADSPRRD